MLQAVGRVAAIDRDTLWIEVSRSSACGSCSARRGCGQSLLSAHAATQRVAARRGAAVVDESFAVGDAVALALPDGALLEAALRAWFLPLLLLVAGLLLGDALGAGGSVRGAAVGGALGLGGGWLGLRLHQRRVGEGATRFLPLVTARESALPDLYPSAPCARSHP